MTDRILRPRIRRSHARPATAVSCAGKDTASTSMPSLKAAAECGTMIGSMPSQPADTTDHLQSLGVKLVINPDAHHPKILIWRFGVDVAAAG